ncbi:hypothetical protein B0H14DRAFT_2612067 [Mycena olivaceomarginata]|nr:hypothetical protein B0H14DRAFT_2612067 [Mycena olivaceomarginata]
MPSGTLSTHLRCTARNHHQSVLLVHYRCLPLQRGWDLCGHECNIEGAVQLGQWSVVVPLCATTGQGGVAPAQKWQCKHRPASPQLGATRRVAYRDAVVIARGVWAGAAQLDGCERQRQRRGRCGATRKHWNGVAALTCSPPSVMVGKGEKPGTTRDVQLESGAGAYES